MNKVRSKSFFVIISILAGLAIADAFSQWIVWYENKTFYNTHTPFYSWGMYSADGQRLSARDGILKLQLNPLFGYENVPNQRTDYFQVNADGFRGSQVAQAKKGKRIVLLGGSAAFGAGLNSDAETMAAQLQQILDIETINGAVISYTSTQELAAFNSKLIDYQPDFIIALNGGNDYVKSFNQPGNSELELRLKELRDFNHPNFIPRAFHTISSLFFPTIRQLILQEINSAGKKSLNEKVFKETLSQYVQNEIHLNKVAQSINAKLIVILQPQSNLISLLQKESHSVEQEQKLMVAALEYRVFSIAAQREMQAAGLTVFNWVTEDIGLTSALFLDNVHLNAEGNKIMASKLAEFIRGQSTNLP
jgi:lysophospholipase L1-like esterase